MKAGILIEEDVYSFEKRMCSVIGADDLSCCLCMGIYGAQSILSVSKENISFNVSFGLKRSYQNPAV